MPAEGSGRKSLFCVRLPAKPEEFARRQAQARAFALGVALAGATFVSGCAGLVVGSSSSLSPSSKSPSPQAQLTASPANAMFPSVIAGSSSSQAITLANGGTTAATISNISVAGTGFGASGLTLPITIAAGQTSAFNITFSASSTSAGNMSGSVSVTSNAMNSTLTIPASASVIGATRLLAASPASLSFGNVTVASSTSLATTLTNNGNANVTISSVAASGSGFTVSGAGANLVLGPSQSAALNATFTPGVTGTAAGNISVASDATNPVTISLSGTGVQPSAYKVDLNWTASTSVVVGYYVYRQTGTTGTYLKLNTAPVVLTQYQDAAVQDTETYTYAVTAVDADGNESDYSNPAAVTVP